jgi:hypothetical protein
MTYLSSWLLSILWIAAAAADNSHVVVPPRNFSAYENCDGAEGSHCVCADFARSEGYRKRMSVALWHGARRAARMPKMKINEKKESFIHTFYQQSFPAAAPSSCEHWTKRNVTYYRLWKCGNNYIKGALRNVCEGKVEDVQKVRPERRDFGFTFVREPLGKFLSGYTESTYRTHIACCTNQQHKKWVRYEKECGECPEKRQNSTDLARDFIRALLDVDVDRLKSAHHVLVAPAHFYSMAGLLTKWRPNFVGHLESFSADCKYGDNAFHPFHERF